MSKLLRGIVSALSKRDQRDLIKLADTANTAGSFQKFRSTRINPRTNRPITALNNPQKQFISNYLEVPFSTIGKYGNIKGTRITPTEETKEKLSNIATQQRAEGVGLNLAPFNVTRANEAAYNPSLVAKGLEADVKTALGTPKREDVGTVKGVLSQYRSDLGYYDLTKQQMEDLLSPTNIKKYVNLADKYRAQLNKTVKQINEYRPNNQLTPELVKLMQDYTYLVKGSNPEYWKQRALTFGHPSPIAANLDHYLKTGSQTSKMLARDPKFLTKMQPELGPLNIAKETLDRGILAAVRNPDNQVTKKGLSEMRKLFDMSGIQSILPGQIYQKMYLGLNNPEQQIKFLRAAIDKGSKPFGKLTQKDVQNIMFGKKTISDFGFFRGGIASLLE